MDAASATQIDTTWDVSGLTGFTCVVRVANLNNESFTDFSALNVVTSSGNLANFYDSGRSLNTARRAHRAAAIRMNSRSRFLLAIGISPFHSVSWCADRPGLNPYEQSRKSCPYIGSRTMLTARYQPARQALAGRDSHPLGDILDFSRIIGILLSYRARLVLAHTEHRHRLQSSL